MVEKERKQGLGVLCVKVSQDGVNNQGEAKDGQLESSSEQGGEGGEVSGTAEDISTNLFPSVFVTQIAILLGQIK